MKQTAMQDLKEDLILTKSKVKDALLEIENEEINRACIEVVNLTLNRIIKRIDDELLEMEKEQTIEFTNDYVLTQCNASFEGNVVAELSAEEYYELTFKSE